MAAAFLLVLLLPRAAADPPQPQAFETLLHATLFGGNSYEFVGALATDGAGNIYVAGYTYSTNLPSGAWPSHDDTLNGTTDAFVAALDPTGSTLRWATYLGGASTDLAYAVAASPNGTVYVSGRTYSTDFPTTPGAADRSYTGFYGDGFVTAFNETGGLLWSTFLGGTSLDDVTALAVGADGTVFAGGYTQSLDFPTTNQVWDGSANGMQDAFVVALGAGGGALRYGTYLGGAANDSVEAIAVDTSGGATVYGTTESDNFPTTAGALQPSRPGARDLFLTRLNETGGALLYSTYLGGAGNETAGGLALDAGGRMTVGGSTVSSDFPTTAGAFDRTRSGQDAFVLQVAADGSGLSFSTLLGGSGADSAVDLALAPGGDILLLGQTSSNSGFPTTADAKFPSYLGGAYDAFVARLSANGSRLLYSTYFGGTSTDTPNSVVAVSVDRAVISGATASASFPATAGAHDSTLSGVYDAFAAEMKTAFRASYATSPEGLEVIIDGTAVSTPFEVSCPFDNSLFVGAPGVVERGETRHVFGSWTPAMSQTHVLRCTADQSFVAAYATEHRWTVSASHSNVTLLVDNASVPPPHSWWCPEASGAWVQAVLVQTVDESRYTFAGWSDGGAAAHAISCGAPGALTAAFAAEHVVTLATDPPGLSVSIDIAPASSPVDFWCPEGAAMVASAQPIQEFEGTRFLFAGWADGSAALPRSVPCDGPVHLEARFAPVEHRVNVTTEPEGLAVEVAGATSPAPTSTWCAEGATLALRAPSPQSVGRVQYAFASWLGLGEPRAGEDLTLVCDRAYGVVAAFAPEAFSMRLLTDPPGLELQEGTATLVTPAEIWCPADSQLLVGAPSPQEGDGVRHLFASWSNGRAQGHAAPCDGPTDLLATFTEEVRVRVATEPAGLNVTVAGATERAPVEAWCARGARLNLSAPSVQEAERATHRFLDWADGAPRERSVPCEGPTALTARYASDFEALVTSVPAGLTVLLDGEAADTPARRSWAQGTTHTVEFETPQSLAGLVYDFTSWSDGGDRRHTVVATAPIDLVAATSRLGAGDFSVALEAPGLDVAPGSGALLVVEIRAVNQYVGPPLEVFVEGLPEGVTARCVPAPVRPGDACALEVRVAGGVAPGEYEVTVKATNGTAVRGAQLRVTVHAGDPIAATSAAEWLVPLALAMAAAAGGALALLLVLQRRKGRPARPHEPGRGGGP
ncbi:MAG TPA: SBBP repeat-containing protein [Candidatus Thermoplasmatota archaeon]